jgi:hypothetical protein
VNNVLGGGPDVLQRFEQVTFIAKNSFERALHFSNARKEDHMLTANYVVDHLQYVDRLDSEFGKAIAKVILEKTAEQLGGNSSETVTVPLEVVVSEAKLQRCVNILINGVRIGHIGI